MQARIAKTSLSASRSMKNLKSPFVNKGKVEEPEEVIKQQSPQQQPFELTEENSPEVRTIERYFRNSSTDNFRNQTAVVSPQRSTWVTGGNSTWNLTKLRESFPKRHQYLYDHLDHMENCPLLVCVCHANKAKDNFISYKYPAQIGTENSKQFNKGINDSPMKSSKAFVYEKEKNYLQSQSKQPMTFQTTNRSDYVPFKVKSLSVNNLHDAPEQATAKRSELSDMFRGQPFLGGSYYKTNFVDFSPGGVYHEKRPHLPIYQLPFKGDSSYQKYFDPRNQPPNVNDPEFDKKLTNQLKERGKKGTAWQFDMPFNGKSTFKEHYKNKKPIDRATPIYPYRYPAGQVSVPNHFVSKNMQEFVPKNLSKCEVEEMKKQIMLGTITCPHGFIIAQTQL